MGFKVTPIVYRLLSSKPLAWSISRRNMVQAHNRKRTPVRIAFGKIIREKRLILGLSQEKLAEKADLHTNYVWLRISVPDAWVCCGSVKLGLAEWATQYCAPRKSGPWSFSATCIHPSRAVTCIPIGDGGGCGSPVALPLVCWRWFVIDRKSVV